MTTGEDAHGCDYFTQVFLSPELCNSTLLAVQEVCPIGLQVPTHLIGAARFRVRVCGVLSEVRDSVAQHGELRDLLLDLSEAHVKQVAHVLAGRLAAVADVEDLADLGEGQPGGLAPVDEPDPTHGILGVVPIAGGQSLGRREQPRLLVEPQGLGRGSGCFRKLSDPHVRRFPFQWPPHLTFHCTGRFTMVP